MLLKKSFLPIHFIFIFSILLASPSEGAVSRRTRKIVCKRGFIRITTINGVKKYSCVVKKKKDKAPVAEKAPEETTPFFSAPLRFQANWWGRVAGRTVGGPTVASNRYRAFLEGEQDIKENSKFVFGTRVTHDLMSNIQSNEYRDDFSRDRSPEIDLWNFFFETKHKGFRVRLGQQQVAWGETFGFFYADLVNPKDLRERSLGRLSDLRLPVPMANVQWTSEGLSLQFLYLPFFSPDTNPTPRSDFFPKLSGVALPPWIKSIDTSSTYKLDDSPGDVGGRISTTIKGVDVALLYFNYLDRQPYYEAALYPSEVILKRRHKRIQSSGLTFSTEVGDGWIIRSENVYTPSRKFNTITNKQVDTTNSAQQVHVLGIDAPKWEKLQLGLQLSLDRLAEDVDPIQRPKDLKLSTFRMAYDLPEESVIEAMVTQDFDSSSQLIQAIYSRPLSDIHELEIYWDQFMGDETSFFGQTERASRIYIGFRGAFNG